MWKKDFFQVFILENEGGRNGWTFIPGGGPAVFQHNSVPPTTHR